METKKHPGSERAKPDRSPYLASERARQGAFSSHPKGKTLPALRVVEALDRGLAPLFALLLAQHPAGSCHGLVGRWFGPLA
jgi:hypothetical protein